MLKQWTVLLATMLSIFSFCVLVSPLINADKGELGNGSAKLYFPAAHGSFWTYEDQDGNELTRTAVEGEEIAGETYHAFEYEPAFDEKLENYEYYVHPTLFKVDDTGIKFLVGDALKKVYKERITKELKASFEESRENIRGSITPNSIPDVEVEIETQNHFYLIPNPIALNQEWDTGRIKPTIKMMMSLENVEVDAALAGYATGAKIYFTVLETGIITGKETVETPAGTFKDCLKVEYRTKTVMPKLLGLNNSDGLKAGESVSTLWLAPHVDIVKFHQLAERPIIQEGLSIAEPTTQMKTLALKKYKIKSDAAEVE